MKLILHTLRKDLRYARVWIILTWLVALSMLLFPLIVPLETRGDYKEWPIMSQSLVGILVALTIGILVVLDPPAKESAFLKTRPVSLPHLCLVKGIVILVLIVPIAFLEWPFLSLMGLEISWKDQFVIFFENLFLLGTVSIVVMILGLLAKSFLRYVAMVGAVGFISLYGWAFYEWLLASNAQSRSFGAEYLEISRLVIALFVVLAGAMIAVFLFAVSKRQSVLVSFTLGTLALAACMALYWPLNFLNQRVPREQVAPLAEWPDPSKMEIVLNPVTSYAPPGEAFSFSASGRGGDVYRGISRIYQVKGLPMGWYHPINSYESTLTLNNDRKIFSQRSGHGELSDTAILQNMGMLPSKVEMTELGNAELAEFKLDDAAGAMANASIKGEIGIQFIRPLILATVPFRKGATVQLGKRKFIITKRDLQNNEIAFEVTYQHHTIWSKGSAVAEPAFHYLVINRARGEYLKRRDYGRDRPGFGHYFIRSTSVEGGICRRDSNNTLNVSPEWLDGAELLVLTEESGGTIKVPFQFSNINLSSQP